MSRRHHFVIALLLLALAGLLAGCGASGTLEFRANGEDFVRQGFVSKDGWQISFDHVYVTLTNITAYQSDPPYDPHAGGPVQAEQKATLANVHTVDLAEGDENADPILVGKVDGAPAGRYNAIHFEMVPASEGPAAGYSLVIIGEAAKEGRQIDFTIRIPTRYAYTCGEYVGDERKGILEAGGATDLEMTFHFDHIFGDGELPADDDLNAGAPGFEPFAALAEGGRLDVDLAGLQARMPAESYRMLEEILPTLGHVGEGHCHCE